MISILAACNSDDKSPDRRILQCERSSRRVAAGKGLNAWHTLNIISFASMMTWVLERWSALNYLIVKLGFLTFRKFQRPAKSALRFSFLNNFRSYSILVLKIIFVFIFVLVNDNKINFVLILVLVHENITASSKRIQSTGCRYGHRTKGAFTLRTTLKLMPQKWWPAWLERHLPSFLPHHDGTRHMRRRIYDTARMLQSECAFMHRKVKNKICSIFRRRTDPPMRRRTTPPEVWIDPYE